MADLTVEAVARQIAEAIEGDYPDMLLVAHVGSSPAEVRVAVTDYDTDITHEFRLTIERQP